MDIYIYHLKLLRTTMRAPSRGRWVNGGACCRLLQRSAGTSAYVSMRQHTSAYVRKRQPKKKTPALRRHRRLRE